MNDAPATPAPVSAAPPGPAMPVPQDDAAELARLMAEAEELRVLGRLAEADRLFQQVLAAKPAHVEANMGAGRCAWARGEPAMALAFFTAAAKGGKYLWPLLHFAADCRKASLIPLAEAAYRRGAELMPDRGEPYLGLAACARRRGDKTAACDLQHQGCTRTPDDLAAQVELARDLQELRRLPEAATVLDEVLARDPGLQPALKAAAAIARERGDTDRALELLQRVETSEPEAIGPMIERIALYRERGEKQPAMDLAEAVLARDPGCVPALIQLGLLHRAEGHTGAATAAFERAYAREPANVAVVLQLARELRTAGDQSRSDGLLALALKLDTRGTLALSYQGEQALLANDPVTALSAYEAAMARAPAQINMYLGAANALARLGRVGAALAVLDQAAERCKPIAALYARRGNLLRQAGRMHEALRICEQGLSAFPESFLIWESVLRLQIVIGNDAETQQRLVKAPFGREGERAGVAALTGDLASERGDLPTAITLYAQAAALQPQNTVFQANLVRAGLARFDLPLAAEHLQRLADLQAPIARLRQKSPSPAQTFLGQILNEYQIDAGARAALATLPRATEPRVAALLELCQAYADNTLLAAALIDTLWNAGAFSPADSPADSPAPGPTDATSTIPLQIAQFWGETETPSDVLELMETWREGVAPDAYQRFDELAARRFLAAHFARDVGFAFHRAATASARSDLFRLAWLQQAGGIHADAFDRRIGPVETLLPPGADLVLHRGELGLLSNGFMAATAGHPVLTMAVTQAAAATNRGDTDLLWLSTGPGLITRCVAQYLAQSPHTLTEQLARIRIWPRRTMFQTTAMGCLAEWKATIQPRTTASTRRAYALGRPNASSDTDAPDSGPPD